MRISIDYFQIPVEHVQLSVSEIQAEMPMKLRFQINSPYLFHGKKSIKIVSKNIQIILLNTAKSADYEQ